MTKPLSELRGKIDAIDDKIFDLLEERAGVVLQVGELKSKDKTNRCFIRPGREADMVRRVFSHFGKKKYSPVSAAAIWRQIIAASLNLESPLKISVCAPHNDATPFWLAREYFGQVTPITREATTQRVVADVVDGRAHIGILPLPFESKEDWWQSLAQEGDLPKIFAYIPCVTSRADFNKVGALAIAYVNPEPTAEDVSFYALTTDNGISQSGLNEALAKAGLEVAWRGLTPAQAEQKLHLVEIKGFHPPESPTLTGFQKEMGNLLKNVVYLGSYATPIVID